MGWLKVSDWICAFRTLSSSLRRLATGLPFAGRPDYDASTVSRVDVPFSRMEENGDAHPLRAQGATVEGPLRELNGRPVPSPAAWTRAASATSRSARTSTTA